MLLILYIFLHSLINQWMHSIKIYCTLLNAVICIYYILLSAFIGWYSPYKLNLTKLSETQYDIKETVTTCYLLMKQPPFPMQPQKCVSKHV